MDFFSGDDSGIWGVCVRSCPATHTDTPKPQNLRWITEHLSKWEITEITQKTHLKSFRRYLTVFKVPLALPERKLNFGDVALLMKYLWPSKGDKLETHSIHSPQWDRMLPLTSFLGLSSSPAFCWFMANIDLWDKSGFSNDSNGQSLVARRFGHVPHLCTWGPLGQTTNLVAIYFKLTLVSLFPDVLVWYIPVVVLI